MVLTPYAGWRWLVAVLAILATRPAWADSPIPIAITFDDVPAAGAQHPDITRTESAVRAIEVLERHGARRVYGFVNGTLVSGMKERVEIIRLWKAAGFLVGNHTYSHRDLGKVSAAEFIADIERNEPTLIDHADTIEELKWLRYPYLAEGDTLDKRYAVRFYLHQRGYRVAPVTIDLDDWAWGNPYIRCSRAKDTAAVDALERSFIKQARARLRYAVALVELAYGSQREFPHVLLLHLNAFTAHMLDRVLSAYTAAGATWITFEHALGDPALSEDTSHVGSAGMDFLGQVIASRKLEARAPRRPPTPFAWLEGLCR